MYVGLYKCFLFCFVFDMAVQTYDTGTMYGSMVYMVGHILCVCGKTAFEE